jgi:radical SAM protein with 4Fe4S-binding SPASM domain
MAINIGKTISKTPELLLSGTFSYKPEGIPLTSKLSFKKKINLLKCGINSLLGFRKISHFPPVLQIEPANICNLKCPLCPTGEGLMKREKGFMTMETFNRIIDEIGDYLITVVLYGWGEPFLNKHMAQMIETCTEKNILTYTSTNGHAIQTYEEALLIVKSGLTAMTVVIDGSTQEIYENYRKGGELEKVKLCIRLIEEAKGKLKVKNPFTNLRLLVTKHNIEDISNVEKIARELNVDMFSCKTLGLLSYSNKFSDYEPRGTSMERYEYEGQERCKKNFFTCSYPFRQPTIFWDGTLMGCEQDYNMEFPWGKIGEESFKSLWNKEIAINLRNSILTGGKERPEFCKLCPYQNCVRDRYIKQINIKK